jgi:hypothetical protein
MRRMAVIAGLCLTAMPVQADAVFDDFIQEAGFLPVDPYYFWSPRWNGPHRFPAGNPQDIRVPDAGLGDAEKAVLAIDALDGPLPHVRYRITSRDMPRQEGGDLRFVEVTRFNLGPTLLADIAESYAGLFTPEGPDGDPAPHVTWRFVFDTENFMDSLPIAVARHVLEQAAAQEADCFGLPCLALIDPVGADWPWTPIIVDETAHPAPYPMQSADGTAAPARIAALLKDAQPFSGPYEMVISSGVVGQDGAANGILRYHPFYVDEVTSDWRIRRETAGQDPSWGQIRAGGLPGDAHWTLPTGITAGPLDWHHIPVEGLPAWRMTTIFETDGQAAVIYDTISNLYVGTHLSDHWLYIGLPDVAGNVLARNPAGGVALPILPYDPLAHEYIGWRDLPQSITPTGGQRVEFGHFAREYAFHYVQPLITTDESRVWTGTFWALGGLPAVPGWYGLPGSPFSGREGLFRITWADLCRDLAPYGLITAADITLTAHGRQQRVTMRIADLAPAERHALGHYFRDLAPVGQATWPHDLPQQPVALLGLTDP